MILNKNSAFKANKDSKRMQISESAEARASPTTNRKTINSEYLLTKRTKEAPFQNPQDAYLNILDSHGNAENLNTLTQHSGRSKMPSVKPLLYENARNKEAKERLAAE